MAEIVINGVDFTPYLLENGYTLTRNDVDSEDSGQLADGTLRRDRVIIRYTIKLSINSRSNFIDDSTKERLLGALYPQWVNVKFRDQRTSEFRTDKFYTSTVDTILISRKNGKNRWAIGEITLVSKGVAGEGQGRIE